MIQKILLAVSLLVAIQGHMLACKCAGQTRERTYTATHSNLVFAGQLVAVTIQQNNALYGFGYVYTYKFVPSKVWRGTMTDTIMLQSGFSNCKVILREGNYVIFTTQGKELNSCSRIIDNGDNTESRELEKLFLKPRYKQLVPTKQ